MPRYMKISDVRVMNYSELERWWEVDFDVLVTTAIAEATGEVHATVAAALGSDDWLEQWADALYAGAGELASSVERMTYTRDVRQPKVKRQAGLMALRMAHVNGLLKTRRREQGMEMLAPHIKDARLAALSILAKHHDQENEQLRTEELTRQGLSRRPPMWEASYRDGFEAIEDAVQKQLIKAPAGDEVRELLSAPPHKITAETARDVKYQQDRCDSLRHPLMLRSWSSALEHLRDRHCELAGLPPSFTTSLTSLDMGELRSMKEEDAWAIINRRRFIRAIAQRWRECQMHIRQVGRTVAQRVEELRQPWYEASNEAREELGRRHQEQLDALIAGLAQHCDPGTTRIRRDVVTSRTHRHLIHELKTALVENRWRTLLDTVPEN